MDYTGDIGVHMTFQQDLRSTVRAYLDEVIQEHELRRWLGLHLRDADTSGDAVMRELTDTVFALHVELRMQNMQEPEFRREVRKALADAEACWGHVSA